MPLGGRTERALQTRTSQSRASVHLLSDVGPGAGGSREGRSRRPRPMSHSLAAPHEHSVLESRPEAEIPPVVAFIVVSRRLVARAFGSPPARLGTPRDRMPSGLSFGYSTAFPQVLLAIVPWVMKWQSVAVA